MKTKRRRLSVWALIFLLISVIVARKVFTSLIRGTQQQRRGTSDLAIAATRATKIYLQRDIGQYNRAISTNSKSGGILFHCPDRRTGLHIVHTRFLVNQADSNPLFQATRIQLMNTFFVPSLAAQTSKSFVLYASHDPDLPANTLGSLFATLKSLGVYVLTRPDRHTAMGMNFSEIVDTLKTVDKRVSDVDLFISSRMDIDDAVHVKGVEAIQKFACEGDSESGKREGKGAGPPVRLAYIQDGLLWFPSRNKTKIFGVVGVFRPVSQTFSDIYKFLGIMQSMILQGKALKNCPGLDVYSYPHYRPQFLPNVTLPGCPTAEFKPNLKQSNQYMMLWNPPEGEIGYLYVRTASSWSHEQVDFYHRRQEPNMTAFKRSFTITGASLSTANLMYGALEMHAGGHLTKQTEQIIE